MKEDKNIRNRINKCYPFAPNLRHTGMLHGSCYMNRGFTLVETMVTIVIISIIAAITVLFFAGINRVNILDTETGKIFSALSRARSLTLASKNDSEYGVHFEESSLVIFKGRTYNASDPSNDTQGIGNGIHLSEISISGGGSDVYFKRLYGELNKSGTLKVSSINDPSQFKIITLYSTGIFEVNQ